MSELRHRCHELWVLAGWPRLAQGATLHLFWALAWRRYDNPDAELQAVLDAVAAEAAQPGTAPLLPPSAAAEGAAALAGAEAAAAGANTVAGREGGAAAAQRIVRSSPDAVLRGPGSSGRTSPGEPSSAQPSLGGLSSLAGQHGEGREGEPPLWTLLEDPEEGEDGEALGEEWGAGGMELAGEGLALARRGSGGSMDWASGD